MARGFRYYATPDEIRRYLASLGYQTREQFYPDGMPSGFDVSDTYIQLGYDIETAGRIVGYGSISLAGNQWIPDTGNPSSPWIRAEPEKYQRSVQLYRNLYRKFRNPPMPTPGVYSAIEWEGRATNSVAGSVLKIGAPTAAIKHWDVVTSLTFSPDGRVLAAVDAGPALSFWDTTTYRLLRVLRGRRRGHLLRAFNAAGNMALDPPIENEQGRLWDLAAGRENSGEQVTGYDPRGIVLSPNGRIAATGYSSRTLKLSDAATGKELRALKGLTEWIRSMAFSGDSALLATASVDSTVTLWEVATGWALQMWRGHTADMPVVAFSPDNRILAVGKAGKGIKLWEVRTGQELYTLKGQTKMITAVTFSADGKLLASSSIDRSVKLWTATTGQELATFSPMGNAQASDLVYALAFSPDGRTLAAAIGTAVVIWPIDYQG